MRRERQRSWPDDDGTLPLTWHDLLELAGPPSGTEPGDWKAFLAILSPGSNTPRATGQGAERVARCASLIAVLLYAGVAIIAVQQHGWLAAVWASLFLVGSLRALIARQSGGTVPGSGSASDPTATDAGITRNSDMQYHGSLTITGMAWLVHWKPRVLDHLSVGLSRWYLVLASSMSLFMCGLGVLIAMIPACATTGMTIMIVAAIALAVQLASAVHHGHRILTIATSRIINRRCLHCGYPLMPSPQVTPGRGTSGFVQCPECGTTAPGICATPPLTRGHPGAGTQ